MTVILASYFGPILLLVIMLPFMLGLLWLLPMAASISLISPRSLTITRRLFKISACLTIIFSMIGLLMVISDERDRDIGYLGLLVPTVPPGVLGYLYWWAARRTHGEPSMQPRTLWQRAGVVMSLCVASWVAVAALTTYLPALLWP